MQIRTTKNDLIGRTTVNGRKIDVWRAPRGTSPLWAGTCLLPTAADLPEQDRLHIVKQAERALAEDELLEAEDAATWAAARLNQVVSHQLGSIRAQTRRDLAEQLRLAASLLDPVTARHDDDEIVIVSSDRPGTVTVSDEDMARIRETIGPETWASLTDDDDGPKTG